MGRFGRWLMRGVLAVLLIWALTFTAILSWTFLWPEAQTPPEGDVIICLGGGVTAGGEAGPGSTIRAETCAALYEAGAAAQVIFTGGPSRPEGRSVAEAMAEVAMSAGLPETAIFIEPHAQSTLQNALFTRAMLAEGAEVILVTEAFHLPRAWASYRVTGVRPAALYSAGPVRRGADGNGPSWRMLVRESLAIWFNAGRALVWGLGDVIGLDDAARVDWLR